MHTLQTFSLLQVKDDIHVHHSELRTQLFMDLQSNYWPTPRSDMVSASILSDLLDSSKYSRHTEDPFLIHLLRPHLEVVLATWGPFLSALWMLMRPGPHWKMPTQPMSSVIPQEEATTTMDYGLWFPVMQMTCSCYFTCSGKQQHLWSHYPQDFFSCRVSNFINFGNNV